MYPLDLSVAAGAQRAQFLSWAFPTDTQIQATHHRNPAVFGFGSPFRLPNSKLVIHYSCDTGAEGALSTVQHRYPCQAYECVSFA